jgi:hypothetical protein
VTYEPAEQPDDDAERMRITETRLLGLIVAKLMTVELPKASPDRRTIEMCDLHMNVLKRPADPAMVKTIKALAWTYRRRLPRTVAPTLNPADPIVAEMDQRDAAP